MLSVFIWTQKGIKRFNVKTPFNLVKLQRACLCVVSFALHMAFSVPAARSKNRCSRRGVLLSEHICHRHKPSPAVAPSTTSVWHLIRTCVKTESTHKPGCCGYHPDWWTLALTSSVNLHPWAPHQGVCPTGQIWSSKVLSSSQRFRSVSGPRLNLSPCLPLEMCPLVCGYPPLTPAHSTPPPPAVWGFLCLLYLTFWTTRAPEIESNWHGRSATE